MKTSPYTAVCREPACNQTILMALTRHGNWQPLDLTPILAKGPAAHSQGAVVLVGRSEETRAVVLTAEEMADGLLRYRYRPHVATCVARKKHDAA